MKLTCTDIDVTQNPITRKYKITLETMQNPVRDVQVTQEIVKQGKELDVEVKQHRNKRSLEANGYLWILCQKLSEKIGGTKEDIYKEAVRKAGQFDFVAVSERAAESFIKAWQGKGIGWYAEASESKIDGCKKIMVYYGSSVYDSKAMYHLIRYVVDECIENDIETLTPDQLAAISQDWGK
ncbi:MAG: hypothetical protein WC365_09905 [Candidatus Babeliales bacterium]|jgi:hypothetical protein